MDSTSQYLEGDYVTKHPDWHLADAPAKALDMMPGALAALKREGDVQNLQPFRIGDIGAGVGGVLVEMLKLLGAQQPRKIEGVGFEISPQAVQAGRKTFPDLDLREKFFQQSDGPFSAVILADVLEHVENPWNLLREARSAARFLIVRQPLLESFSTFRHHNYRNQREQWGHIGFFSYYSFLDMAFATGWKPLHVNLVAPWDLVKNRGQRIRTLNRLVTKINRPLASYLISGFYLNGAFERITDA